MLGRIANGLLHTSFARWQTELVNAKRMGTICTNVLLRLQNQQAAFAIMTWRRAVQRQQHALSVAERFIGRMRNTALLSAWLTWSHKVAMKVAGMEQATRTQSQLSVGEEEQERKRAHAERGAAAAKVEMTMLHDRVERAEAKAASLELELAQSKLKRTLSEADEATVEGAADEVAMVTAANEQLQVSVATLLRGLETERLQSEVLAAEKVAAQEKVRKLERRLQVSCVHLIYQPIACISILPADGDLQRALDAGTAANLHGALWEHGVLLGRSSSFGGVATGRLGGTKRGTVSNRLLEHGLKTTDAEARRGMTRPAVAAVAVLRIAI